MDARPGKATAIDVTGTAFANAFGTSACPIPADLTSVDVTSASSNGGGLGVILPFYHDTCYVNQTLPASYRIVP